MHHIRVVPFMCSGPRYYFRTVFIISGIRAVEAAGNRDFAEQEFFGQADEEYGR